MQVSGTEIVGKVGAILFPKLDRFDETTYRIFRLDGKHRSGIVTGHAPGLRIGVTVACKGGWETHPKHGQQFAARIVEERFPVDHNAIADYLVHAKLPAIGRVTAKRVVAAFGDDTFATIEESPEKLATVKGIAKKSVPLIHRAWLERIGAHRVMLHLQAHGVGPVMSQKICTYLAKEGVPLHEQIAHINADPYCISYVSGVGFLTADTLAKKLGVDPDAPSRLKAGAVHVLRTRADNEGHIYCDLGALDRSTAQLLDREAGAVAPIVTAAANEARPKMVLVDDATATIFGSRLVALPYLQRAEETVARELRRLASGRALLDRAHPALEQIDKFKIRFSGKSLNDQQIGAVRNVFTNSLSVVTGRPGSGKTTIMDAIMELARQLELRVHCCAPTGLAALRLGESTASDAATIHSSIGLGHPDGPMPITTDILIVDEFSMVGVPFAATFFPMIRARAVVFVGDIDQLPSIEPGNVLRDLIASEICAVTTLTKKYRQGIGSRGGGIVDACEAIMDGQMPAFTKTDFLLTAQSEDDYGAEQIADAFADKLAAGAAMSDVMILAPMRKGPVGIDALNTRVQERVNPERPGVAQMTFRNGWLREGDRVMQLKNDMRTRGLVNGDIGVVLEIDPEKSHAFIAFNGGRAIEMDREALRDVALAYAITVHKSQGSEFKHVIASVSMSAYVMLSRNILYTLVSRARESCHIVGSSRAIRRAITKEANSLRETRLVPLLQMAA
jgi:exodeoxyribonuclease V alpha subunit